MQGCVCGSVRGECAGVCVWECEGGACRVCVGGRGKCAGVVCREWEGGAEICSQWKDFSIDK